MVTSLDQKIASNRRKQHGDKGKNEGDGTKVSSIQGDQQRPREQMVTSAGMEPPESCKVHTAKVGWGGGRGEDSGRERERGWLIEFGHFYLELCLLRR